jgi:Fic family protein
MGNTQESTGLMEPMIPSAGNRRLEDLALDLVAKANKLAGQLNPVVQKSIGHLVLSMNCYYSNLIEGHDTHPRDIDRALHQNFAQETDRRALQLEAVAHIEVQRMIDGHDIDGGEPTTWAYIEQLHYAFCSRLPDDLLWVTNPDNNERIRVVPGALRTGSVQVGRHIPLSSASLPHFLTRFEEAYDPHRLSKIQQVISIGAAHHRLVWIHPFYDGNGRVTRLLSHAMLIRCGVGSSLWSVARGLARNVGQYKHYLMVADEPRRSDLDGRGNLSEAGLCEFVAFFLETCIDQVEFMESLLEPNQLSERIKQYVEEEMRKGQISKGAFPLLREALFVGEIERGKVPELTGYKERMARNVMSDLVSKGLLVSDSPRGLLRLGFPIDVVERWFPRLYPVS